MSREHAYLQSASRFIGQYRGQIPLSEALKRYFAENKKHGSRDRKEISRLCYCFYRLGKALPNAPVAERVQEASRICEAFQRPQKETGETDPNTNKEPDKLPAGLHNLLSYVFPFADKLPRTLDSDAFVRALLNQPDVFVRIRQARYTALVCSMLERAAIGFSRKEHCLRLGPGSPLRQFLQPDELYVVQDFHSQQVFRFLTDTDLIESRFGKKKPKVWDCCAGSGGKSILIHDLLEGHMELTVSDIRTKMRPLLQERFTRAGIGQVNWFTTDLSRSETPIPDQQYDIIICDVPCTGSGTWSRHPEQLYFFDDKTIDTFSRLQRQIVTRALSRLADNGLLLYVTCSVFSAENEQNVDALCDSLQLHSLYRRLLDGTESRCDSLFTAVMVKKQDIPDKNQK